MKNRLKLGTVCLLLAGYATSASAVDVEYKVSFAASNFSNVGTGAASPATSLIGEINYFADSVTQIISSVSGVSLTVDGHAYNLSEIGFVTSVNSSSNWLGGLQSGVGSMTSGTNDFELSIARIGSPPSTFYFTTATRPNGVYWAQSLNYSISAVPENPAIYLLSLGLLALAPAVKRRPKRETDGAGEA